MNISRGFASVFNHRILLIRMQPLSPVCVCVGGGGGVSVWRCGFVSVGVQCEYSPPRP